MLAPGAASLAVLLAVAGSAAAACTSVAGGFTSVGVLGPPCASPILLCTDGTLTGQFVMPVTVQVYSTGPWGLT